MQGTKIKHPRIRVVLPSIQKKTERLVIYFSMDTIQIRLLKLLVGKMKLDFDCTTVVT